MYPASRFASLALLLALPSCVLLASEPLWRVGRPDNDTAEFALAPGDFARFKEDGFYVVGASDEGKDWCYAHPGPIDGWAGSRQHTFTILFGLERVPDTGECRLRLDLADTHPASPPLLRVEINGHASSKRVPAGAGDASVHGRADQGRECVWEIPFPVEWLQVGDNAVSITSLSGSWVLYDAITLEAPVGVGLGRVASSTRITSVHLPPVWLKRGEGVAQPLEVSVRHVGESANAVLRLDGGDLCAVTLESGTKTVKADLPAVQEDTRRVLELVVGRQVLANREITQSAPELSELWILPHSHVDIGYTHPQAETLDIQIRNLEQAIGLARESATNPAGERFKWNPEAVWAVEHFLERASPELRTEFVEAVRRGDVGVDALYGNMLTGLCRPEELIQCLSYAQPIARLTGVSADCAAICDVPGWTWGLTTVLGQAGVKYFAIGPNYSARIGTIHRWDNRPFYWVSPSGQERVLCFVVDNYHFAGDLEREVMGHAERLARTEYPYDVAPIFWVGRWPNGGVDNAPPDAELVEKVRAWNAKVAVPRLRIGLIREFFADLERRHGPDLPEFAGDITPYWEDGAGSTARETGLNRASAERLVQAETLFAMLNPTGRPAERLAEAWRNVLLYSEHTWGAWCSISDPDNPFTLEQWKVKQAFALDADRQSREILALALAGRADTSSGLEAVDVLNTTQWERTDLVQLEGVAGGVRLEDSDGHRVPVQQLDSGAIAFVAEAVPPFGARRYSVHREPSSSSAKGRARANGNRLSTSVLQVEVDERTGAIRSLGLSGVEHEFVDHGGPVGLNDFRYVLGADADHPLTNGPVRISVLEDGPLVASLRIESDAPGCRQLVREVRVVEGLDWVEVVNHLDREVVREKDAVHFGFGFAIPGGTVRMETPCAVVRPNIDQLPGSCHNWFTVQRWVDVSNSDLGVTWAPVDAPLMEIGGLTANLMGPVSLDLWRTNTSTSTHLYSWAQNNHWFTNYKVDQPGVTTFRYLIRPHAGDYAAANAARFGVSTSRSLILMPVDPKQPPLASLLTVSSPDVLVETLRLTDDGRAVLVRLYGASGEPRVVRLAWESLRPRQVWLSDPYGVPLRRADAAIEVPGYGMVTLRGEL